MGIDVAKAQSDIAVRPSGERWTVPNDADGVATLVAHGQALHPTLMSGSYRWPGADATAASATAGLPVVVVNPRQARDLRAPPDSWPRRMPDARAWRISMRCSPDAPAAAGRPDAESRAPLGRRQQLIVMRTAEQNRLAGTSGRLQTDIEAHITWLNERLATLDDDIETLLRASPLWRENDDLLQSAPGIGPCVPGRCCWNSRSWGPSIAGKSQRWWAWRHSIAIVGPSVVGGGFGRSRHVRTVLYGPCGDALRSAD